MAFLLVTGYWLLVTGYWLLVAGCWSFLRYPKYLLQIQENPDW